MAGSGEGLLPFLYPDFYAKQLPIQRQQALAQMLMQQGGSDPGTARYGGLRNAGSMLAGALLGRRADSALGQLYSGPENPGASDGAGQVSNAAQAVQGNVEQPYEGTDSTNLFPELHNNGGAPQQAQAAPAEDTFLGFKTIPSLGKRASMAMVLNGLQTGNFDAYVNAIEKELGPTDAMKQLAALYGKDTPQYKAGLEALQQSQVQTPERRNADYAATSPMANGVTGADLAFLDKLPPDVRMLAYQHGVQSPEFNTALGSLNAKNTSIPLGRSGTVINGQVNTPATGGIFTAPYALGSAPPPAIAQPGYAEANARIEGAKAGATEPEKIINVTRSDGSVVPMRAGNATGQAQPPQLFSPRNPQGGYQPVPGAGIGQSTAQAELQKGAGQAAVEDAKLQPVIATARDAIKHALALNQNAPDSKFLDPETVAEYAKRFGSNPYSSYKQQWDLDVNGVIVDAFKQLKSAGGRFPQALADEVIKANGVPFDAPKDARSLALQRLDQILGNFGAASQNTVAGMNAPGAATTTRTESYAGDKGYKDQVQAAPMPAPPAAQRKAGQTYLTPKGPMLWSGTGWRSQ